ncbi:ATP-binding protein [Streptomyces sp. NPDC050538]|uniref:ATP-binding protein n=1 Tax=Streptomyces sp. NPDC050538 TaxID=3365627 RepID=UPI00379F7E53
MDETIKIVPRQGDDPPRRADACRVGTMRRIAAAQLRICGLQTLTDDVMLLVSELVTNAVLHSGTDEVRVTIEYLDGSLTIAVADGMPGAAKPRAADENADSGRGLALVEAVVMENGGTWGTRDEGAVTWCRLAAPMALPG